MDEQLTKSLTDLIDETLSELEELRKSKMSAAEIKLEGPGEGIAGKPSDGELDAKKAEDEEDEEDEEKEDEEAEKSDDGHEQDDPADKPSTKRKLKALMEAKKAEDSEEDEEDEEVEKSWKMSKKEKKDKDEKEPHKDDPEHEEKEKKIAKKLLDMHKSSEEMSSLMKSYIEERVQPLEQKLQTILELVNSIAEQPVAPKGVTVKTAPLLKSNGAEYGETLSKAEVANKLFELKKSGARVDSLDIAKAEMGQDLANIVKKYEIS